MEAGVHPTEKSWFRLEMLDNKPLAAEIIFICVLYNIGHVWVALSFSLVIQPNYIQKPHGHSGVPNKFLY